MDNANPYQTPEPLVPERPGILQRFVDWLNRQNPINQILLGIVAFSVFFLTIGLATASDSTPRPTADATATPQPTTVNTQVTERVGIECPTEHRQDAGLPVGQTKLIQACQHGVKEITYAVVLANGVPQSKTPAGEKVVGNPVTQIIANGTYRAPVAVPDYDHDYPDYDSEYAGGDLDCADVSYSEAQYWVAQGDPHGFDGDGDGEGCESNY